MHRHAFAPRRAALLLAAAIPLSGSPLGAQLRAATSAATFPVALPRETAVTASRVAMPSAAPAAEGARFG
ncbi:MAG TPA: hypothetical protein VFX39_03890, partial [Gemmatimonadaceae bacterium]|nr:hypothetical protein [Gemmatimonadaceae bacterium]